MEEEKEKSLAEALMSAEVSDTTRHLLYCKGLVLDLQRSLIDEYRPYLRHGNTRRKRTGG
jgi:hypothetical protein